jgi:hypothetical protein
MADMISDEKKERLTKKNQESKNRNKSQEFKNKDCPLLREPCKGPKCAWYTGSLSMCAILNISDDLDKYMIMDQGSKI